MAEATATRGESAPDPPPSSAAALPRRAVGTGALDDLSVVDERDTSAWAIPYTDLTMLLLVFFVIMLSQAEPSAKDAGAHEDPIGWVSLEPLAEPEGNGVASAGPSVLHGANGVMPSGGSPAERQEERDADLAAEWSRRVRDLEASAAAFLDSNDLYEAVGLVATDAGVELRMSDDLLFSSGSAMLETQGAALIDRLAPLLQEIDGVIEVTGHTDDVPIQTTRFPSNWELSAARAIAVVRFLRDQGVPASKMKAVGHGANRPIASNDDPGGRAANRRVTIDIVPRLPRA